MGVSVIIFINNQINPIKHGHSLDLIQTQVSLYKGHGFFG